MMWKVLDRLSITQIGIEIPVDPNVQTEMVLMGQAKVGMFIGETK